MTYLPHNLIILKLYNHGLGICSQPASLLNLLGFFLILLFDQSQWSLVLFNLRNLHHLFLPYGFYLWIVKTFDLLNYESLSMSDPHMCMVSTY